MAGKRAQFACEQKRAGPVQIIKRLLAEAIAGQEKLSSHAIIDGERKPAIETLGQRRAPLLVAVHKNFRVRMAGAENMTARLQGSTQLQMIVDLAVVDDADIVGLVPHRLVAAREIEARQPAVAKDHVFGLVDEEAFAIGSSMDKTISHRLQMAAIATPDKAGKAAHQGDFSKLWSSRTMYAARRCDSK